MKAETKPAMSDFGTTSYHKGYKDHRCEWCGGLIPQGEQFAHFQGAWGGDWQNWRMHLECDKASAKANIEDGFEPFSHLRGSTEEK